MKPEKIKYILYSICILFLMNGCTFPLFQCFLNLTGYEKTYNFNISKAELKSQIINAYTYDKSLLLKNFELTLIENEEINKEYHQNMNVWLDKKSWNDFKTRIRENTTDTLNLIIGKYHNRNEIRLTAIIKGDNQNSSITIKNITYQRRQACNKEESYYKLKISNKIEKKLIKKLK